MGDLSAQLSQLQLAVVAAAEATVDYPTLQHYTADGAENNHPNQAINQKLLEVSSSTDGITVLSSIIPNGFAIVDNEKFEGKKIIVTKPFKKGSLLYIGHAAILDLSAVRHTFKMKIYSEDRQLLSTHVNDNTHSVDDYALTSKTGQSARQVYGWDGFMNHSCDANAIFSLLYRIPDKMCYRAIAMRDIQVGDEITCDYALFDYECNGHSIEICACGSTKCRGKMLGFKGMSLQEKVDILHMVEGEIKDKFIQDENIVVHKSSLPQGVGIITNNDGTHLIATRKFDAGEALFTNCAALISMDDLNSKKFVLEVDEKFVLLNNEHHFIYRDSYAEMLGFDVFMDHSCSPSTEQEYISKDEYVVRAKKTILAGEKITCDYMALENNAIGQKNVGMSTFVCKCGESNCKGVLVC